mgnify:CR=1 FL=1
MTIKIITNNHNRPFIYRHDVPQRVLNADLDWTSEDEYDGYIHYKGTWYHRSQFMRVGYPGPMGQTDENGYHGYHGDSFFSGIAIRLSDDCETYQIATFILCG